MMGCTLRRLRMESTPRWGITLPLRSLPLPDQRDLVAALPDLGYTDAWSSEVNGADAFTPLAAGPVDHGAAVRHRDRRDLQPRPGVARHGRGHLREPGSRPVRAWHRHLLTGDR